MKYPDAAATTATVNPLGVELTDRVRALHQEVLSAQPALCAERAVLVTRYFRQRRNRRKPVAIQKAEALAQVLREKVAHIYPGELLVGCFTSHRVGGGLFPELHGVAMLEDLFRFERRKVNPLSVSARARRQLLAEVMPFWLPRFLSARIRPRWQAARFIARQLGGTQYLINEAGGISHFVPDYAGLLGRGTQGYRQEAIDRMEGLDADSDAAHFLGAVVRVCQGLEDFAEGYRQAALRQAAREPDQARRGELERIAEVCGRVPRHPARSFHEGLQAILFAQIALNLESLDNSVCPGRLDQILASLYRKDLADGSLDRTAALELLGCWAVKLCEIVPAFSQRLTRFHGGLFNGQVVVVGGTDRAGEDATGELSALLVTLMAELRTRQPNYHARIHRGSPAGYRQQIAAALARGAVSPALYSDEVIVPLLEGRGVRLEDARDYATVGCVEPVAAGKSFFSTDAALLNAPLCLEWALNQGRRFGERRRQGAATRPAEQCTSIDQVVELFRRQLVHLVDRLLADLRLIEIANAEHHPTPLTSMLLEGCLERRLDASSGGARYNASGIQPVGSIDVGDSLAALEAVVFRDRRFSMAEVVQACRRDFRGAEALQAWLGRAPKYGNDDPRADRFVARVMELFSGCLDGRQSSRGGAYAPGYYSVTAHEAFGSVVGAMPSGRQKGAPLSSGLSPTSGSARSGPTAALLSQARLPLELAPNGLNYNLEIDPWIVRGDEGAQRLGTLLDGGLEAGCMQMQVNVLDPQILVEARDNPGRYPGLLVRVSGYSAYFDDLSPSMKQEIIDRNVHGADR